MLDNKFKKRTYFPILGTLLDKPMTGFEIKKFIDNNMFLFWKESYGQIYPSLKKLCIEKYIEILTGNETSSKKLYSITEKGKEYIKEWLSLDEVSLPQNRNELLLKVFFSFEGDKYSTIKLIEEYRKKILKIQKELEIKSQELLKKQNMGKKYVFWRITVLNGLTFCEAEIKWTILSMSLIKNYQF